MSGLITDEMLQAFAVVGTYDDIVDKIRGSYGTYANSVSFSIPVDNRDDENRLKEMLADLKRA